MTTVDDGVLHSTAMTEYLDSADRRIVIGARFILEALGLPVPEAAQRRSPGRTTIKSILNNYHADNPAEAIIDHQRNLQQGFAASCAARTEREQRNNNDQ